MKYYITVIVHLPIEVNEPVLSLRLLYKTTIANTMHKIREHTKHGYTSCYNRYGQEMPDIIDLRGDVELFLRQ